MSNHTFNYTTAHITQRHLFVHSHHQLPRHPLHLQNTNNALSSQDSFTILQHQIQTANVYTYSSLLLTIPGICLQMHLLLMTIRSSHLHSSSSDSSLGVTSITSLTPSSATRSSCCSTSSTTASISASFTSTKNTINTPLHHSLHFLHTCFRLNLQLSLN